MPLTSYDVTLLVWRSQPVALSKRGAEATYTCPQCQTANLDVHLGAQRRGMWHCWSCGVGGKILVTSRTPLPETALDPPAETCFPRFSGQDYPAYHAERARRAISRAIAAYSDSYPSRLYDRPAMSLPVGLRGWLSRLLDDAQPKYMRSPGSNLYLHDQGRIPRWWAGREPIYVLESALDVLRWLTVIWERRVDQRYFRVVALNGLSVDERTQRWLKAHHVIWVLDNDPPGESASEKYLRRFLGSKRWFPSRDWPKAPGEWLSEHWDWFLQREGI
jgi:ribosomal protein L37AE/L43A